MDLITGMALGYFVSRFVFGTPKDSGGAPARSDAGPGGDASPQQTTPARQTLLKLKNREAARPWERGDVVVKSGGGKYVYVGDAPTKTGPPGGDWILIPPMLAAKPWQAGTLYHRGDLVTLDDHTYVWRSATPTRPDALAPRGHEDTRTGSHTWSLDGWVEVGG